MEAAANYEGYGAPIWSATTNWIAAADESLRDAISLDTSSEIEKEEEEEEAAKPILLLRPQGDDPPPCEITVCFRKKHEIHRVYVRSTARVYEIYYSSDHRDSSEEYLCTVRCIAAVKGMIPQSVTVGATNECQGNTNGTTARPDQLVRSDNNISDEDGWVQIKTPDSLLQDGKEYSMSNKCDIGIDSPMMQIHYEATAEISDYNPCTFLTLRLLSIQTKACVHIEEIYVYADPVELPNSDMPAIMGKNLGGSSLLAMLVPSLMQLSKSGASRERLLAEEAKVSKYQHGTEKTSQSVSSDMANTVSQEVCSLKSPDQKWQTDQKQNEVKADEVQTESMQEITAPHQMSTSLDEQNNNQAYSRLEKVFDKLVLKVERVEAFCSKFEENMFKPLSCMEQRLQQLELKLDALVIKTQSSEQCHCMRISSSESNEYDPEDKAGNSKHTESREDTSFIATASPVDEVEPSAHASQTRPGLVIKAPDFVNEDDDCSNTEETSDPSVEGFCKNKKPLSIDSFLASSLAEFLTSTTVNSPDLIPSPLALSEESINGINNPLDSFVGVSSKGAGNLSDISTIEENGCNFLDVARKGNCFSDSSLLSRDAAIVINKFSSDTNKSCGESDVVNECTAFEDSLLAANANLLSPAFCSQAGSGFIVMAPEFLNRSGSSNCDDILDSHELDSLEDRSSSVPTVSQPLTPLAEFLSSTIIQSSESIPAPLNAPSGLSSSDSNELSASPVTVSSEGADESGTVNQERSEMKDDVNPILSTLHREVSFNQQDHHGMVWKEWLPIEKADELPGQNLPEHTLPELNAGISQTCHGGSGAGNNDAKEAILHGFDQPGRGWIENSSSTSSSVHENLIKQRVETEWSVGGSSDSSSETFLSANHSKWQAATSNVESNPVFAFEKAFDLADHTSVTCQSSAGCCWERHDKKLEDMICNVEFTLEKNWVSGLPLELLLGHQKPDPQLPEPSTSGGIEDGFAPEPQLHNSLTSQA